MLNRLINFLKEDSEKPERQDVVIFVPTDTHIKKFIVKINDEFKKNHLRQAINLLSKPNEPQLRTKNNIFLVNSVQQLIEWDYDLSSLFYVVDFEKETIFSFDY